MSPSLPPYNSDALASKNNKQRKPSPENIRLIVFDMDGVLTDIHSSWQYVHDYFGRSNRDAVDAYLQGTIDDEEFMRRDCSLWETKGQLVTKKELIDILSHVPLMKGARECLRVLKQKRIVTAIVSAGLDLLSDRIAKGLGIDYVYANGIQVDEKGRITGEGVLRVKLNQKDTVIHMLSKQLLVPLGSIAAVGNSCFDAPMLEVCGLGIAFNPSDECIRQRADIIVEEKDLRKLLPVIEDYTRKP
jgi:phosphoserine phosphatase